MTGFRPMNCSCHVMVKMNVEMNEFGDVRPLIIFALHNGPVDGAVNKTTGYITNKVEMKYEILSLNFAARM